jgi:hypothetical protein
MPNELQGDSQNAPDQSDKSADIGNMVNAAVTAHLKRFAEKTLPEILKSQLETALKSVAPAAPPPPAPETETTEKASKSKVSPELAAMQQKLDETLKALKDADERRIATEKKAREDRAFSELKSTLAAGQVRPEMLDMVANHLFRFDNKVELQEDGTPLFKTTRNSYGIEEEVNLPLKDGVEAWLKSESAKAFLPAPGVSQVTPAKKTPFVRPPVSKDIDLDKASPQEKINAAAQKEAEIRQKLAAAGRSI